MKTRHIVTSGAVLLAILVVGILVLQNAPLSRDAAPGPLVAGPTPVRSGGSTPTAGATPRVATASPRPDAHPGPAAPAPGLTDWEQKIEGALNSKAGETEVAQQLINLLPTMPPEGQAEAASHITNLILDKDYNRILPLLRNPALPTEVQDVLVTDLMNREDAVKLPALLDVAKIPNHPYQQEALTDLQLFLNEDNGTNWAKWDGTMKEYLRKQQAELSAAPQ